MPSRPATRDRKNRILWTGMACAAAALAMVAAAFAAVPLYNLFCRVTGFDGTPIVATAPAERTLDRFVTIRFDANVAPGLDWQFLPETPQLQARVGETQTVFYRVHNRGTAPATGIASFNVQPGQAGGFFVKLECFCFKEQTLAPGESLDFPVVFYIDPAIAADRNLDDLAAITLSYTYFTSRNGQPVRAESSAAAPPQL